MTRNHFFSLAALVLSACFPRGQGIALLGDTGDSQTLDTSSETETGRPDTGFDTAQDTSSETGMDTSVVDTAETGWTDTGPVDTGDTGSCTTTVWYEDADGDGYGNVAVSTWNCTEPPGYVDQAGDYDDTDSSVRWSPCQQSLLGLYGESYSGVLWPGSYDDLEFLVTVSESTEYVTTFWEDATSPDGFYLVCGEVSGSTASVRVQMFGNYYANTFTTDDAGSWEGWNSLLIPSAVREDWVVFTYQGQVNSNAHLAP